MSISIKLNSSDLEYVEKLQKALLEEFGIKATVTGIVRASIRETAVSRGL